MVYYFWKCSESYKAPEMYEGFIPVGRNENTMLLT